MGSDPFGKEDGHEKKLDFNIDIVTDFVFIRMPCGGVFKQRKQWLCKGNDRRIIREFCFEKYRNKRPASGSDKVKQHDGIFGSLQYDDDT